MGLEVMELFKRGWLQQVLGEVVAAFTPDTRSRSAAEANALPTPRARARRYLKGIFRETGLLYGTPKGVAEAKDPKEALFAAVVKTLAHVALDVAVLADAAPAPRKEQLLLLFAATFGELGDAADIHRRIEQAGRSWPVPPRVWARVEERVEQQALTVTGDPYFGLVLHNGALYADAQLFGRLALAYFSRAKFPTEAAARRRRFSAGQKAVLVEVLIGLVCAERQPSLRARRAILGQIDDLRLPDEEAASVREFARQAFERPPSMKKVVKGVRSRDSKRFLLEQVVLASLVDGRRSAREVAWMRELGVALGVSKEEVHAVELQMAEFYRNNRQVVDVFTVAAGADVMGEELVDSMQRALEKNFRRLLKEVKETGELSVLLARAAAGHKLTREERKAMRAQLIDVAKAIPALAIFAAPGGILLLIALAKVLPFSLLPSSFQDEPEDGGGGGREQAG